jgi:hypothetical protein
VGGYLVYKTVVPKKPPSGEALKPLTEGLPETPSESEGEEGGEAGGIRKDPLAQGATEGKAEPGGESLRPTDNLDQYVGTWEFVGEPGPWGEGFPFKLRRSGDGIAGTAGQDGEVKIDLTSTAVGLEGSSTDRSGWVMRLTLTLKDGLLTVQAQPPDGEVITRVAKKAAG